MTNVTTSIFYTVADKKLSTVDNGFALPITTYLGEKVYGIISLDGQASIAVDLNKIINQASFANPSMSYSEVLTIYFQLKGAEDVMVDFIPRLDLTTNRYNHRLDVFDPRSRSGWGVNFGNIDNPSIVSDLDMVGTLNDLILTPPNTVVPENCLVAVNGIFHATQINNGVIYVIDGFSTAKQVGRVAITVCDTTSLGGHTVVPITADMLSIGETTFTSHFYIKLPNTLLFDKSVLFSWDGYLQAFNGSYSIKDSSALIVRTGRVDYKENFIYSPAVRASRDAMSLSNMENPYIETMTTPVDQGRHVSDTQDPLLYGWVDSPAVSAASIDSVDFLKARLCSRHSFVVVINNSNLFVTEYPLINKGELRLFENFNTDMPRGLLFYGRGYVVPYLSTFNLDTNQHLILVDNDDHRSVLYQTGKDNPTYPSARADWLDYSQRPCAKMVEIYSGNSGS